MIFLDYNGVVASTGKPHVGHRGISGRPKSSIIVVLSPGAQALDTKAWEAVRERKEIGWDGKEYQGRLIVDGELRILPSKDGKSIDWKAIQKADLLGERGIIGRTIHPLVLESLRKYALGRATSDSSWSKVVAAVTKHLKDVCTGFDGEKVDPAAAQEKFVQVAGG